MSDEQKLINIITSQFASLVSFTAFDLKIDSVAFKEVAKKIQSNDITVIRSPAIAATEARYDFIDNRLILGAGLILGQPYPDSLIVHECVHAISDIKILPMKKHESEAVAYLAQTIYLLAIGRADFRKWISKVPSSPLNELGKETIDVAERNSLGSNRHIILPRSELRGVVRLVRQVDLYSGWKRKEQFAYDGV